MLFASENICVGGEEIYHIIQEQATISETGSSFFFQPGPVTSVVLNSSSTPLLPSQNDLHLTIQKGHSKSPTIFLSVRKDFCNWALMN